MHTLHVYHTFVFNIRRRVVTAESVMEADHHFLKLEVIYLLVAILVKLLDKLFPLLHVIFLEVACCPTHDRPELVDGDIPCILDIVS